MFNRVILYYDDKLNCTMHTPVKKKSDETEPTPKFVAQCNRSRSNWTLLDSIARRKHSNSRDV